MIRLNEENEIFFNGLRKDCQKQGRIMKEPTKKLRNYEISNFRKLGTISVFEFNEKFNDSPKVVEVLLEARSEELEYCYYYILSILVEYEKQCSAIRWAND